MATGGKLEVQIGADNSDFKKKIAEVESDIRDLSKVKLDKLKLGLDTKEINAQIKDAKNSLATLKDSVGKTGTAIGGQFTKQTANGSNALMQFSRIAQDAPYGIIGIGNNITATAESFGYLKAQTGSTSGALKAMASSLMGTGGILLGVSLLTTGFTLLSQSGLSVGDIIDKVTGKFDAFGQSIKKSNEEAAKAANNEISSLKSFVSIAQDRNLSDEKRNLAVQELQKLYPNHLGNLEKEKILNGDISKVVDILTNSLYKRSQATALLSKMDEKAVEQLQKFDKYQTELNKVASELNLNAKEFRQFETAVKTSQGAISDWLNQRRKVGKTDLGILGFGDALGLNTQYKEIVKVNSEMGRFQNRITALKGETIEIDVKVNEGKLGGTKAIKPEKTFNFREAPTSQTGAGLFGATMEIPAINGEKAIQSLKDFNLRAGMEFTLFMKLAEAFNDEFSGLVEGNLNSSLSNLGESIGQALASGQNVFSAIGNSLLQSLGSFLSDMGGLLIKYGVLAVAKGKLDLAIATGGPISIAAGLAAIGVGVLLKAAGGAIGSKASGGQTSTATGQGANNTSTTSGVGTGWSGGANGTVVFEIAGTSLIGVLNNTTERNLRIGGR